MARSTKPAGDFTGRQTEKMQQERAAEIEKRQGEIATATRVEQQHNDSVVIDYMDPEHPKEKAIAEAAPDFVGEGDTDSIIEEDVVDIAVPRRTVKITDTFKCTLGYGNNYEFIAGQRYELPVWVIEHLDEKGFVA